jgi:hypothetical protein
MSTQDSYVRHEKSVADPVTRAVAIAGLAAVALIHLLDAHDTFISTPVNGWLYVCLITGCVLTAGALLQKPDRRAWLAATLLPLGALVAFVYSRTVGLPGGADDIGNWWEPLGLSSLFVESCVVAVGASVLQQVHPVAPFSATRPRMTGLRTAERSLR